MTGLNYSHKNSFLLRKNERKKFSCPFIEGFYSLFKIHLILFLKTLFGVYHVTTYHLEHLNTISLSLSLSLLRDGSQYTHWPLH